MKKIFFYPFMILVILTSRDSWAESCTDAQKLLEKASYKLESNPVAAEEGLREAIGLCDKSASLHYNLALVLYKQGKYDGVEVELNKALERKPYFTKARELLEFIRTVDIDINLPKTRMENEDALAIVIGNRDYKHAKKVEYAISDALAIRKYLIDVLGFKDGNIGYYENATKGDFDTIFGKDRENYKGLLFNNVQKKVSDIFIFYSGHGAPGLNDKKGYFFPIDALPKYAESGGYSLDLLYENLSKIPTKSITVVVDACFSGANLDLPVSPVFRPIIPAGGSWVFLSSSSGTELSSWYEAKRHGLFTYFFLKAIHSRSADYNKDGKLTFDELHGYLSNRTEGVPYYARKLHGVDQTPTIDGQYNDRVFVKY